MPLVSPIVGSPPDGLFTIKNSPTGDDFGILSADQKPRPVGRNNISRPFISHPAKNQAIVSSNSSQMYQPLKRIDTNFTRHKIKKEQEKKVQDEIR